MDKAFTLKVALDKYLVHNFFHMSSSLYMSFVFNGKPANAFGYDNKCMDKAFTLKVGSVQDCRTRQLQIQCNGSLNTTQLLYGEVRWATTAWTRPSHPRWVAFGFAVVCLGDKLGAGRQDAAEERALSCWGSSRTCFFGVLSPAHDDAGLLAVWASC
jgi:hypothetical protein